MGGLEATLPRDLLATPLGSAEAEADPALLTVAGEDPTLAGDPIPGQSHLTADLRCAGGGTGPTLRITTGEGGQTLLTEGGDRLTAGGVGTDPTLLTTPGSIIRRRNTGGAIAATLQTMMMNVTTTREETTGIRNRGAQVPGGEASHRVFLLIGAV